jgi:tetratricopeptide (TPR) repeat protein
MCRLGPCRKADAQRAVRLAERAVAAGRTDSSLSVLGVALYRAGRYREAVQMLEESNRLHRGNKRIDTILFLALAHHGAGNRDQALFNLQFADRRLKNEGLSGWFEKTYFRLARRDAEVVGQPIMPRAED